MSSKAKYRLVIFDSDGTLADTLPWMRSVFNELADQYGFKRVEEKDYDRIRDMTGLELLRELELPLWKLPRVVSGMRGRMACHIGQFSLFDGIPEMLARLHAGGIVLGVVSSNSQDNVRRILGEHAGLIDHYACGASMFGKANKLRALVKAASVASREAIYLGDESRDGEAARKAGIAFGAVAWGHHGPDTLRALSPAEFFERVEDIGQAICPGEKDDARL